MFCPDCGTWNRSAAKACATCTAMLPEVRDSSGDFGTTDPDLFGAAIPIRGVAGDQQAALFGQLCISPGMAKCTYGTGAFLLANTGERVVESTHGLIPTVGYHLAGHPPVYALEGSIAVTGSLVQWLRDGLKAITASADVERLMKMPDCIEAMRVAFKDFSDGVAVNRPRMRYLAQTPDPERKYMANVHVGAVPSYGIASAH